MTTKRTITRCVTLEWGSPRCSDCDDPIDSIKDAYAAWLVDEDGLTYEPQVVHRGGRCGHARRDLRREQLDRDRSLADLAVEWLRRSPLEAIHVAIRAPAEADDDKRLVWVRWVAVVLGLPASAWNAISALDVHDEVADIAIDKV